MSETDTRQKSAIAKAQAWQSDINHRRDKANNSFNVAVGHITSLQAATPAASEGVVAAEYHFPTLDERVKELALQHVGTGSRFVVANVHRTSTTHTLMNKIFNKDISHDA